MNDKDTVSIDLTPEQLREVERLAQAKNMTVAQFAAHAVGAQLRARYVAPKRSGNVHRMHAK